VSGARGIILSTSKQVHPADRVLGEVFVEGFGVSVSKKSERLVVKRKGEVIFERPFFDVERVIVSTEGATISAAAIHECVKNGIPMPFQSC
jgi:CRISP-associated protein Cas1